MANEEAIRVWSSLEERLAGKLLQLNRLLHQFEDAPVGWHSQHHDEEEDEVGLFFPVLRSVWIPGRVLLLWMAFLGLYFHQLREQLVRLWKFFCVCCRIM